MMDEFMMVCNNLRNDLTHANEYVVGVTLKLISRIAIRDILDALIPPIYEKCLTHIESFVRRNAVECLYTLYNNFGSELLHDLD
jgi:coatomer subunit beta